MCILKALIMKRFFNVCREIFDVHIDDSMPYSRHNERFKLQHRFPYKSNLVVFVWLHRNNKHSNVCRKSPQTASTDTERSLFILKRGVSTWTYGWPVDSAVKASAVAMWLDKVVELQRKWQVQKYCPRFQYHLPPSSSSRNICLPVTNDLPLKPKDLGCVPSLHVH